MSMMISLLQLYKPQKHFYLLLYSFSPYYLIKSPSSFTPSLLTT